MSDEKHIVQICDDLMIIFGKIKKNVSKYTWGAEDNLSNFKASKILAQRINTLKLY